jgi:hypothetical protein
MGTSADGGASSFCAASTKFESYFTLLYTRPLTIDADVLSKDFAVTVLGGDYVVVASSTPPEAAPARGAPHAAGGGNAHAAGTATGGGGDGSRTEATEGGSGEGDAQERVQRAMRAAAVGAVAPEVEAGWSAGGTLAATPAAAAAARADGAAALQRAYATAALVEAETPRPGTATTTLAASPVMDTVALHLVRLSDGKMMDRRVFRDDYIRLRREAAISTQRESDDATLLTVLSLRWQAFHVLRVERRTQRQRGQRRQRSSGDGGGVGLGSGVGAVSGPTPPRRRRLGIGIHDIIDAGDDDDDDDGETEEVARFVEVRSPMGAHCASDDDAPLVEQDRAEREWLAQQVAPTSSVGVSRGQDQDGVSTAGGGSAHPGVRVVGLNRTTEPATDSGWSNSESLMYTGIKQKVMTRVFLEAQRRDRAAEAAAAAAAVAAAEVDAAADAAAATGATFLRGSDSISTHRPTPAPGAGSSNYGISAGPGQYGIASGSFRPNQHAAIQSQPQQPRGGGTQGGTLWANQQLPQQQPPLPPRRCSSCSGRKRCRTCAHRHPPGAFTAAFFSRYRSYAEWLVTWHVQVHPKPFAPKP